jgi:hypothetical protein
MEPAHSETGDCRVEPPASILFARLSMSHLVPLLEFNLGGFHLFAAKADALSWTADKLKEFGVAQILGAHCTGIEPVLFS